MTPAHSFPRITSEPDKLGGAPCIRGTRIPVAKVLRCVASGMSRDEILGDYPLLVAEDIDAAERWAARQDS
jgi:uncharacterized protein (DUF433 family)